MNEKELNFFDRLKRYGRKIGLGREKTHQEKSLDRQHFMAGLYGHNALFDGVQDTHSANVNDDIVQRYLDYEKMDDYDITSSILDVYADDSSQLNPETGHVLEIKCDNDIIKSHLEFLYHTVLKVDEELWEESRNISKYGNNFDELIIKERYGVVDKIFRPTPIMRRIEDSQKQLVGFVRDDRGSFNLSVEDLLSMANGQKSANDLNNSLDPHNQVYEDFEMIHTRLRGKNRGSKYGYSVLEGAREAYKRLWLLENNQINTRITKGDPKRAFFVDVGTMPEEEVEGFMQVVKNQVRRKRFLREDGSIDLQYNPNCLSLSTKIPVLSGPDKTLKEMIDDFNNGLDNYVYSVDRVLGIIVPCKVSWAGMTRKNAKLVKVTLDNGLTEIVTPDHKFVNIDGDYVEAKDLEANQSLMPFRRGFRRAKVSKSSKSCITYEYVKHPSITGYASVESTHRMVARVFDGDIKGMCVHHIDEDKYNNNPENLEILTEEEHRSIHEDAFIGARGKLSEQGRNAVIRNNKLYKNYDKLREYNNSDLHEEHNKIRRSNMKSRWADGRDKMSDQMKIKFTDELIEFSIDVVDKSPHINTDDLCDLINSSQAFTDFKSINSGREIKGFHRHLLLKMIRCNGYENYSDFKSKVLYNHKVVSVEFLDYTEDTACITVDTHHNFALSSGVFVKNSSDDDFYIPMRNGVEKSRVETIDGLEKDLVNSLEYFQKKLHSATKVPRSFLGYEDEAQRVTLSSQDIRFARSVLRVQNSNLRGKKKAGDVHLTALGLDVNKINYSLHLVTPSAIFDEIRYEIMRTQLDIAEQYQGYVSKRWIMKRFLGFQDFEVDNMVAEIKAERDAGFLDESLFQGGPEAHAHAKKLLTQASRTRLYGFDKGLERHEKMIEDNMEKILEGNQPLKKKIESLKSLTQDLLYNTDGLRNVVKSKQRLR